jgi:hypothetical protein
MFRLTENLHCYMLLFVFRVRWLAKGRTSAGGAVNLSASNVR